MVAVGDVTQRIALPLKRFIELSLLGVLPIGFFIGAVCMRKNFGFDLHQFWQGGRDVIDGVSPYPPNLAGLPGANSTLGPEAIPYVFRFPYPAGSAFAMVPLALLPFNAAAVVLAVFSTLALLAALRLLGVRDWRCYCVTLGSLCVISAVRLGTLTPLILFSFALAWRFREKRWVAGSSIAFAVVLKIFPWPMIVWLAATRRYAAAAMASVFAAGMTAAAWAAIGFAGASEYPHLLRRLADLDAPHGYSLVAFGSALGAGGRLSHALPWIVGACALGAIVISARTKDGDRKAFSLSIAACILCTPVVWLHYFVLLYAPVALWRRSLSVAWALPLLFLLTPSGWAVQDHPGWRTILGFAIATTTIIAAWVQFGARRPRWMKLESRPATY